jgi:hypothetical protein
MNAVLKKSTLIKFLKSTLRENRAGQSASISAIPAKDDPDANEFTPIIPEEEIPCHLSTAALPVHDEDFVPSSNSELGLSAQMISKEVPTGKIEKFYLKLHDLLDNMIDETSEEDRAEIYGEDDVVQEAKLRYHIKKLLNESESPEVSSLESNAKGVYTNMFITLLDSTSEFLPAGVFAKTGRIEDTPANRNEIKIKMYEFLNNHASFRDLEYENNSENRKVRKLAVQDAIDTIFYKAEVTDEDMEELEKNAASGYGERAEKRAKHKAVRSAVGMWNPNNGDLDAIIVGLEELSSDAADSFESMYFEKAREVTQHIIDNNQAATKTTYEQALKAVILSDDLDLMHADELYNSQSDILPKAEKEDDLVSILRSFDTHIDKLAPFYGYSGGSGLAQWMTKFPERMYKVLVGGAAGIVTEWASFSNDVVNSFSDFIINTTTEVEKIVLRLDKKIQKAQGQNRADLEAKKSKLEKMIPDLQNMNTEILDVTLEEPDIDTLISTPAGWLVRFAYGRVVTNMLFTDLHSAWTEYAVESISSAGIKDTNKKLAKTLIGETDPPELKGQEAEALLEDEYGITVKQYRDLAQQSAAWFKEYFSINRKELRSKMRKRANDITKIKNAIEKTISVDIPDEISSRVAQSNFRKTADDIEAQEMSNSEENISESFESKLYRNAKSLIRG